MTGDYRFVCDICKSILAFPSCICFDVRCNIRFWGSYDKELIVKMKELKHTSKGSRGHFYKGRWEREIVQSRDKSFGMYKQTQTKSVVKVKLFYTTTLKYYSSTL